MKSAKASQPGTKQYKAMGPGELNNVVFPNTFRLHDIAVLNISEQELYG